MGGSNNEGNFLNPKNLIPAAILGPAGVALYGLKELKANTKPPDIPKPEAPPSTPPPSPQEATTTNPAALAAQRQRRLSALRYGFASTITNLNSAPPGLKATLGS